MYYLFVEIDPDNVIDEIHENRRASSSDRTMVDIGGNNMGYIKIGVTDGENPPFDRSEIEQHYVADDEAKASLFAAETPAERMRRRLLRIWMRWTKIFICVFLMNCR